MEERIRTLPRLGALGLALLALTAVAASAQEADHPKADAGHRREGRAPGDKAASASSEVTTAPEGRVPVPHRQGLPGPAVAITTINLGRDRRDSSEDDRLTLNLLRPHLNQASRNAEAVTSLETELARVRGALELIDRGVIVLRAGDGSAWMTHRAQHLPERYFGRPGRRGGALPEPLRRWIAARRATSSRERSRALASWVMVRMGDWSSTPSRITGSIL